MAPEYDRRGDELKRHRIAREIRRDVYSVKVWDTACGQNGAWCHNFMTYDRVQAVQRMKDEKIMLARSGYPPRVKLVHPAQWVLEAYVVSNGGLD